MHILYQEAYKRKVKIKLGESIIAMRSSTTASKAVRALTGAGIRALKVSVDPALTRRGCGFGVSVSVSDLDDAVRILDRRRISYGDILGGSTGYF